MADIQLTPGSHVLVGDVGYTITHVLDSYNLVGVRHDTGEREIIRIADIEEIPEEVDQPNVDIHEATPEQIEEAQKMLAAITPLMSLGRRRRKKDVEVVAESMKVHPATIYRWIEKFKNTMTLASLIKDKPDGGRGDTRIKPEVEKIIEHYIKTEYLTPQKKQDHVIIGMVQNACERAGLPVPHRNTVIDRLKNVPGRIKAKKRGEVRELEKHTPTPGKTKIAKYPLHVYQIDHTQMDVEIVDDEYRLPIGRPWITVAIDVWSRMVSGFIVSLDAPSALSVGLCLTHAIMPKENWLAQRGIEHAWPIFGKPATVHSDNGVDFKCEAVTLGCQNNLIDIVWRPVKKPRYGAHIERLLGTVGKELKALPGATFSNPKERGSYVSADHAVFSLREIECWVAEFLLGKYHNRRHGGLNTTPLKSFEEGIHGTATKPGRGLPTRPTDGKRLLIDFLPYEERTVQPDGVTIDNIQYFSRALDNWVGSKDKNGDGRLFRFHRDPRAISPVFFYDPDRRRYIDVPYADLSHPVISQKELEAANDFARAKSKAAVDEHAIFRALTNMRRLEEQATETTKSVRRDKQKKKSRAESLVNFPTSVAPPALSPTTHVEPGPVVAPRHPVVIEAFEVEESDV